MACPICCFPDIFAHGRIACRWRRCHNANIVKAMLARAEPPADPDAERLRLAWWVVRRACREWLWWPLHEHAVIAQRDAKMARKPLSWQDESDPVGARARRDVARIAADRWALAALEEFTTPPEPSP